MLGNGFCNNHLVTHDVIFALLLCSNLPAPCHLDMGASLAVPPAAAAAGRLTIGHPCSDLLARFAQALVWFSLLPRPRGHLSELSRRLPPYCYMVLYCVILCKGVSAARFFAFSGFGLSVRRSVVLTYGLASGRPLCCSSPCLFNCLGLAICPGSNCSLSADFHRFDDGAAGSQVPRASVSAPSNERVPAPGCFNT